MGFSGSVNGTTTKTRFFGFWFLPMNVNGPIKGEIIISGRVFGV